MLQIPYAKVLIICCLWQKCLPQPIRSQLDSSRAKKCSKAFNTLIRSIIFIKWLMSSPLSQFEYQLGGTQQEDKLKLIAYQIHVDGKADTDMYSSKL